MEDIRIYDFEFNLLHIAHDYVTSNWTVYYNDIGTWEAHFALNDDIVPVLMDNGYLVAVQGGKSAIITGKQLGNDVAVYGRTCNWLLSRRVTKAFKTSEWSGSKDAETITRRLVQEAFSDVSNFTLGAVAGFTDIQSEFWRNTAHQTFDVVKDCLDNATGGHVVDFDVKNKKWVYRCLRGQELPLILSEANRNAQNIICDDDILDCYTAGYYEFTPETTDGSTADPEWVYISGDKTGIYKWDAVLTGSVESEAKSDLAKRSRNTKLQADVHDLRFGVDYNLGDKVRVQKVAGSYKNTFPHRQITGVNIWYEYNNTGTQPILEDK